MVLRHFGAEVQIGNGLFLRGSRFGLRLRFRFRFGLWHGLGLRLRLGRGLRDIARYAARFLHESETQFLGDAQGHGSFAVHRDAVGGETVQFVENVRAYADVQGAVAARVDVVAVSRGNGRFYTGPACRRQVEAV